MSIGVDVLTAMSTPTGWPNGAMPAFAHDKVIVMRSSTGSLIYARFQVPASFGRSPLTGALCQASFVRRHYGYQIRAFLARICAPHAPNCATRTNPVFLEYAPVMRPERYNVRESEAKWRKAWADAQIFKTENDDPRPKYYVLEMFPYPSGRIHMGHVRNYAMGDVVARYRRARGFNVLHPMGWDAFGLPAENAAMQNNTSPAEWTYANIAAMRAQLQSMGLSLDWSREIATCDPSYYKHQQKLFLDFLDAGLVARKKSKVNWDPVDQTVLANEQVIDGRGWRSGAPVEQRELTQWFLKITDYSDDLLASLDHLERWPEKVRLMQKNWIGRSEGLSVRFVIDPATLGALKGEPQASELDIYTTRPDTLFGAKFMAIAPDHPLAAAAAKHDPALHAFIEETRKIGTSVAAIETAEKKGYDTGPQSAAPVRPRMALARLCRQFRSDGIRLGRDFRLPRPRSARPRFCPRLWPGRDPGGVPARARSRELHHRRRRL